jgi:hypothetical protein
MKLTIIPSDKAVYVDGISFLDLNLTQIPENVHALQWLNDAGFIEFNDGSANLIISNLPDWANNSVVAWNEKKYVQDNPPVPTHEELIFSCKSKAKQLLAKSDWAVLPDVGLANQEQFIFYRLNLRNLVKNPVINPVFETEPNPVWA